MGAFESCMLLGIPQLICSCIAGAIGVIGGIGFAVCVAALAAPTP